MGLGLFQWRRQGRVDVFCDRKMGRQVSGDKLKIQAHSVNPAVCQYDRT